MHQLNPDGGSKRQWGEGLRAGLIERPETMGQGAKREGCALTLNAEGKGGHGRAVFSEEGAGHSKVGGEAQSPRRRGEGEGGGGADERGSVGLAPRRGPAGERRGEASTQRGGGLRHWRASPRGSSFWAARRPTEAPRGKKGPKANSASLSESVPSWGRKPPALDMHRPPWLTHWPIPGLRVSSTAS